MLANKPGLATVLLTGSGISNDYFEVDRLSRTKCDLLFHP